MIAVSRVSMSIGLECGSGGENRLWGYGRYDHDALVADRLVLEPDENRTAAFIRCLLHAVNGQDLDGSREVVSHLLSVLPQDHKYDQVSTSIVRPYFSELRYGVESDCKVISTLAQAAARAWHDDGVRLERYCWPV